MSKFQIEEYWVSQPDSGELATVLITQYDSNFAFQLLGDDLKIATELVRRLDELEQLRDRVNRTREALKESLEHHEKLDSVEGLAVTQQLEWVLDMLEDKKND